MKNPFLPVSLVSGLLLVVFFGALLTFKVLAHMGYVNRFGWDFTPRQTKQFLRQRRTFMERTNSRLETLISEGEDARREGNLPAAEQAFKAIINSPEAIQYPNEIIVRDYVLKAQAELAKVQAQEAVENSPKRLTPNTAKGAAKAAGRK